MTKERQNEIIKEALVSNLQKQVDIKVDIGATYAAWLQGKIKLASDQLTAIGQAQEQQALQQAQGQEQQ